MGGGRYRPIPQQWLGARQKVNVLKLPDDA
jgi:hypothetical protein